MLGEIIKIKNNEFVPTTNALGVPELKMLWDNVDNPEIYFLWIHYYCFPVSAYSEVPEYDKINLLNQDFPVDSENPFFIVAKEKAEILYNTPLKRIFLAAKKSADNVASAVESQDKISFGRDGNFSDITSFLKNSEAYMLAYTAAEKRYKEEISMYGSREIASDDNVDYQTGEITLL